MEDKKSSSWQNRKTNAAIANISKLIPKSKLQSPIVQPKVASLVSQPDDQPSSDGAALNKLAQTSSTTPKPIAPMIQPISRLIITKTTQVSVDDASSSASKHSRLDEEVKEKSKTPIRTPVVVHAIRPMSIKTHHPSSRIQELSSESSESTSSMSTRQSSKKDMPPLQTSGTKHDAKMQASMLDHDHKDANLGQKLDKSHIDSVIKDHHDVSLDSKKTKETSQQSVDSQSKSRKSRTKSSAHHHVHQTFVSKRPRQYPTESLWSKMSASSNRKPSDHAHKTNRRAMIDDMLEPLNERWQKRDDDLRHAHDDRRAHRNQHKRSSDDAIESSAAQVDLPRNHRASINKSMHTSESLSDHVYDSDGDDSQTTNQYDHSSSWSEDHVDPRADDQTVNHQDDDDGSDLFQDDDHDLTDSLKRQKLTIEQLSNDVLSLDRYLDMMKKHVDEYYLDDEVDALTKIIWDMSIQVDQLVNAYEQEYHQWRKSNYEFVSLAQIISQRSMQRQAFRPVLERHAHVNEIFRKQDDMLRRQYDMYRQHRGQDDDMM